MKSHANDIKVSVFARTDAGMQRRGNEDAFLVADLTTGNIGLGPTMSTHRIGERGSLMVVSDGMGGAAAGEVASEMAVKTIREVLMGLKPELDICAQLNKAIESANERIWNYAHQNLKLEGMGATLTAVLVHKTSAYIAQVGDSRAYLMRGDQIKQLTKDQSLVQALLESGAIEPEQVASIPQNVIMQALGTSSKVVVVMAEVELCRDDQLLVCSDGLSNKVTADEMRQVVRESENLTSACRRLVEIANERGGEDNITVIVARFDGDSLHSAAQSNSITGSFKILSPGCLGGDLSEIGRKYTSGIGDLVSQPQSDEVTTLVFKTPTSEEFKVDNAPIVRQKMSQVSDALLPKSIVLLAIVLLIVLVLLMAGHLIYRFPF